MISPSKITEIFFIIDEFCKEFEKAKDGHLLESNNGLKRRNRSFKLSDSEVITILVLFYYGQFRNLKHFYLNYVVKHLKSEFPETVSYNRFVELQKKAAVPMGVFLKTCCLGSYTGVSL
ncbi:MAG: hypothetical protein CVT95_12390 [Bacteroidetes bacterium HGW-Bacteroidetes-12]|nr:MAG: hypothetical protein CVT95_12390 [Bacteroidetes bacterium HGW-Bacteroidetes-12]